MPGTIEDLAALALAFYNKNHGGRLKLYDFIARLDDKIVTAAEAEPEPEEW
jgi:hypothetical protein